ncbi:MAG: Gfo/Idh/MocA family oxidoreductase [Candidatus Omnitrophica bacterium]|nr:Gfo/Idh/MocA family oxidoreductase [Candidatus Omnitrophota bacterium]
MGEKIRIAVIGCGTVVGYGHLPDIEALQEEDVELTGFVDTDPVRLEELSRRFPKVRQYSNYQEMLASDTTDIVVIATLSSTHYQIALDAMNAGKHVLVEKPPSLSPDECFLMEEKAKETNLICAVDFILRYQKSFLVMREMLEEGVIGKLFAVRTVNDWAGADHRGMFTGRQKRIIEGGSSMFHEGIHFVDMIRWISHCEFKDIYGAGVSIQGKVKGYDNNDHCVMLSRLDNGVLVNMEESHSFGFSSKDEVSDRQFVLMGTDGVIIWTEGKGCVKMFGRNETRVVEVSDNKDFISLYRDFLSSVKTGRFVGNIPTIHDGYEALKVVWKFDSERTY